jgi:Domain of unknown function (DUF3332)
MNQRFLKLVCAVTIGCFSVTQLSGCAAGGFGLTKSLGKWNGRFSIVPRVLIYLGLFIVQVYTLTLLFDFLLNNTIEFWSGTPLVAQNQTFEKDGQRVVVQNTRDPLRKTVITVYDKAGAIQTVNELRETPTGTVEIYVNSEKKAELGSIGDALVELKTLDGQRQQYIPVNSAAGFDHEIVRAAVGPLTITR